jgi:hypothetical protein
MEGKDYREWQVERRGLRPDEYSVSPDDDYVLIMEDRVIVLHREDETPGEYRARLRAAKPPLSARQEQVIRAAAAEYWEIVRERRP